MDEQIRAAALEVERSPDDRALRASYAALLLRGCSVEARLALLDDLAAWDAADPAAQDAACAHVSSTTPGVAWTGAETFACGGQRHRIGVFEHPATGLVLHLLPGGEYQRGTADPRGELAYWLRALPAPDPGERWPLDEARLREWIEDEVPAHTLRVLPLLLARATITEAQYERRPDPFEVERRGKAAPPSRDIPWIHPEPLVHGAWCAAAALRLPSEAEWEWACRAGTTTRFFWGDEPDPTRHHAWNGREPAPSTAAHGNAFGLRDMVGNGHERCADPADASPQYRPEAEQRALRGYAHRSGPRTPAGDGGGHRLRGGCATRPSSWDCRSALRTHCASGALFPIACRPALSVFLPRERALALVAPEVREPDARRFEGLLVRVVGGDIALRPCGAVVNAANDQLLMGGGVAGALRAAGGLSIEREATRSAPAPLGSVVRTGAGDLLAEHVYHAVMIRHDLRGGTSPESIRVAIGEVLRLARADEVRSVAVPLLGAGVGGLTIVRSLEAILDALEEHEPLVAPRDARRREREPFLTIEVVVLDPAELEEARAALRAHRDRAARTREEERSAQAYIDELEGRGG